MLLVQVNKYEIVNLDHVVRVELARDAVDWENGGELRPNAVVLYFAVAVTNPNSPTGSVQLEERAYFGEDANTLREFLTHTAYTMTVKAVFKGLTGA